MVSMRYFWGVGEFRSVKSRPCGSFTSKMGAATARAPTRKKSRRCERRLNLLVICERCILDFDTDRNWLHPQNAADRIARADRKGREFGRRSTRAPKIKMRGM